MNKGPFTWYDSQGSHRHLVNKWLFTWDDSQRSHRHFVNKGPFTWNDSQGYNWYFVNKGPFTWDDSQRSHINTLWTKDPLLKTILKDHIDTLWTNDPLLGTIRKGLIYTLWTKDPLLGTIRKGHIDTLLTKDPLLGTIRNGHIDTLLTKDPLLGTIRKVSLILCAQRMLNTKHMVNVCKSSLKMNHREDWAMIPHLLCGHMTRLLEARGNGPTYTLWTHDPSIGNTWQRSHVHFVDTWHFYWKHVETIPCTLCGHMIILLETSGNGPMYTLWANDTSIENMWQLSHVHFVDTWPFYWKHVATSHVHFVDTCHFYWKHVATVPCTLCG